MTLGDLVTFIRQQYNAVGDNFFSDAEIYSLIYAGCMELSRQTRCIRRVYTTSTVASQQEYTRPTNTVMIKRITYNGNKLYPVTMREDDSLTMSNSTTTATGTPQYYFEWSDSIYLRPVPSGVGTLKIFSINQPQAITSASTLEVPERYHLDLADYVLYRMAIKDKNPNTAAEYLSLWRDKVLQAIRFERMALRGDSFTHVQDEDLLPTTVIGAI